MKHSGFGRLRACLMHYDIGCEFCRKFWQRAEANTHLTYNQKLKIYFAIGEFHVHGHKEECYVRYSSLYKRLAGINSGEILESLWSGMNLVFPATRSMTAAHRGEVIDDHMNHSNKQKLEKIGKLALQSCYNVCPSSF